MILDPERLAERAPRSLEEDHHTALPFQTRSLEVGLVKPMDRDHGLPFAPSWVPTSESRPNVLETRGPRNRSPPGPARANLKTLVNLVTMVTKP